MAGTGEETAKDLSNLDPDALFDAFIGASQLLETLEVFSELCSSVNIDQNEHRTVFQNLKDRLTSWKCQTLWKKLDKRAEQETYKKKPCAKNNVLVIGCGPCGLRFAIEAALLGANVIVLEKRNSFSRNNVLHLWPFLIYDLKNLGAKKFFGRFCAGTLDHISIRRLQLILLKVALILGVQVYAECMFAKVKEPFEGKGWTAEVKPENHPASKFEFDVVIGTDGRRHTLKGFKRKEFRGKLAIAITMNFINRNTKAEARVEEISGVAFIFNQGFFQDLKEATGIDLENIVYYKDETHYFVMTAKKKSLLLKGVLKKDLADPRDLLAKENVSHACLLQYAREAADFCTNKQLPHLDFALNAQNKEDIAMFDFTSIYAAENAAMIFEMKGKRLLSCLAGDSLMEPFWPTGSGCARGFLAVFDAAWMMRGWGLGHSPIDLIMEREGIYKLLAQTTCYTVSKNYDDYSIDPRSRYQNATISKAPKDTVRHLYKIVENSLEETLNDEQPVPADTGPQLDIKNRVSPDLLLSWCQKHTKGYKNVHIKNMSSSWKSGLGFCALIHKFRPDLIDFDRLNEDDIEKNNELAFSVAENELGIPPQISAVEMAENEKTNLLTMVTYITQYYEAFKDEKPVSPRRSLSGEEASPENKSLHKSPLSKLSVISRISMRTKKSVAPNCAWQVSRDRIVERRRARRAVVNGGTTTKTRSNTLTYRRTDKQTGWCNLERKARTAKDSKMTDVTHGTTERQVEQRIVGKRAWSLRGRMIARWMVFVLYWIIMLLPRVFIFLFVKDKRKHKEDVTMEKSNSKKYKVAQEKKENTSPSGVELKSYKPAQASNGEIAVNKQSSDTTNGRTTSTIGALAELVFGSEQDQNKNQQSKTSAVSPIRKNRGSVGDSEHCYFCRDRIFVFERLSAEGFFFHRKCFKCEHCEMTLRLGNYGYVPPEEGTQGKFYCKQHYRKIFYETPGKSPPSKKQEDELVVPKQPSRRSHSIGNIDMSRRQKIEKPIEFETTEVASPPKRVLKVPKTLRDEINKDRHPSSIASTPSAASSAGSSNLHDVSVDSSDLSLGNQGDSETIESSPGTPVMRKKSSRKAVYNKYSKLEARPLRRSSISATRKSDKGTRRLFVHKSKPRAKKAKSKSPEAEKQIVLSDDAPPKPPRTFQEEGDRDGAGVSAANQDSSKSKRRRNSKRAMYPPSMAFPDSFLVTKAVDIPLDDEGTSPNIDQRSMTKDLRECLGESTPKQVGRQPTAAGRPLSAAARPVSSTARPRSADGRPVFAGEAMDPNKHWSTYYKTAISSDQPEPEDTQPEQRFSPTPLNLDEDQTVTFEEEQPRALPTLHEDREMSPTSPKKHWWPNVFGHKKEKKSKEEKVKEKKLKEEKHKEHKKEKKEKKKKKKAKKSEVLNDKADGILSDTDDAKSPVVSEVEFPADGYIESSEEEDVPELVRLARAREKRYQKAEKERQLARQKKNEQFNIRLEMRQRQQKRLRIAQSIQRELDEVEVRQMELEKRGVIVEKRMQQLSASNRAEEEKLVLEWFDLVNRKNTLIRYESELVIHSSSIELEDQQQRLEQQIRELLMKEESSEDDQLKIEQLTRELVDIVEQRNTLVELLEQDRKREQEEDEVFEMMMASKAFSLSS